CPAWRSQRQNQSSFLSGFSPPCPRRPQSQPRPLPLRELSRHWPLPAPSSIFPARAAEPPCRAPSGRHVWDRRPGGVSLPPSRRTWRMSPFAAKAPLHAADTNGSPPPPAPSLCSFLLCYACCFLSPTAPGSSPAPWYLRLVLSHQQSAFSPSTDLSTSNSSTSAKFFLTSLNIVIPKVVNEPAVSSAGE